MTQVRVRSALPLSIVRDGVEVVVEETDDVKNMIADGKLIVLERIVDADEMTQADQADVVLGVLAGAVTVDDAAEGIVGQRQDGWRVTDAERREYDATHGEADPKPGDPDFDEYDSQFDAELDAPLPPDRKRRRGA